MKHGVCRRRGRLRPMSRIEDRRPVGLGTGTTPIGSSGGTVRPTLVGGAVAPQAAQPAAEAGATATVMGIPETELTPRVRDAIMRLMGEVDQLRGELNRTKHRRAELERLADRDTLQPLYHHRAFVREQNGRASCRERVGQYV